MNKYGVSFTSILAINIAAFASMTVANDRPPLSPNPRYEENYQFLADPSKRTDFYDSIKYIPLGNDPTTYLSFGGEIRERFDGFLKNPLLGTNHLSSDNYFLHRSLVHADLHVSEYFRGFFQFGYHEVWGKSSPVTSLDRDNFDVQQAFAEVNLPLQDREKLGLRVGRQEMLLGSERLVSSREGPNIRRSFDALRAIYSRGAYNFTGFVTHPVDVKEGVLDDAPDYKQAFFGVYGTAPITKNVNTDLYYLGFNRDGAIFSQGIADEKRHSVGTRLWGESLGFDYNFEAVYQFGTFGQDDITAWTLASDSGYSFTDVLLQPRIGLKADIASGDKNNNDKELNTFNALFPKGAYFTQNALIGPANFIDLQPNITVIPRQNISVNFGADILWRENTNDAIYRQPNIAFVGTAGKGGQYSGTQWFILTTWQIDRHASITVTYVHFAVGDAIKSVGGGDSDYVSSWMTYRF